MAQTKEGWLIDEYTDDDMNRERIEKLMRRGDGMPSGHPINLTVRRVHKSVNWM